MQPSERQQKIYDTWKNEDCNILIQAVAGSGKSTVLLELGKQTQGKCLYLAFNKTIQLELEEKIKDNNMTHCSALTLHGLGLSMINKVRNVEINDMKIYSMIYQLITENKWLWKLPKEPRNEIDFVRYALIDCNNISRLYLDDNLEEIEKNALIMGKVISCDLMLQIDVKKLNDKFRHHFNSDEEMINSPDYNKEYQKINKNKFIKLWNRLLELRTESYQEEKPIIDFLDMIYLPVIKNVPVPNEYEYLYVDECQDLNLLQHKMVDKLINQGGIKKSVFVGDKNQSIYLFSGAYSKSFDLFKQRENTVELPLDINYRCSTNIINYANIVYNNLVPFKSSEGVVKSLNESDSNNNETGEYTLDFILSNIDNDCLIICRNTKPLIKLYFDLLSINRTPSFIGNEILNSIINFLKPSKKETLKEFKKNADNELKVLQSKSDNSEIGKLEYLMFKSNIDTFYLILKRIQYSDYKIIEEIIDDLKLKLSNKGDIKLCTIHKSKGLEHKIVYILNESLIPSKFALSEEQIRQEENLRYVARTRAKEELYLLNLKDSDN